MQSQYNSLVEAKDEGLLTSKQELFLQDLEQALDDYYYSNSTSKLFAIAQAPLEEGKVISIKPTGFGEVLSSSPQDDNISIVEQEQKEGTWWDENKNAVATGFFAIAVGVGAVAAIAASGGLAAPVIVASVAATFGISASTAATVTTVGLLTVGVAGGTSIVTGGMTLGSTVPGLDNHLKPVVNTQAFQNIQYFNMMVSSVGTVGLSVFAPLTAPAKNQQKPVVSGNRATTAKSSSNSHTLNSRTLNNAVYNANGDASLRVIRRPIFDNMKQNGIEVNGNKFTLSTHAYNSLFKSGTLNRKDIMPADIITALSNTAVQAKGNSVKYVNPITGTMVYVNPTTNLITGVQPFGFIE